MGFRHSIRSTTYGFAELRELMARATPLRSGDQLAGLAAGSAEERVAARHALADLPLAAFLNEAVVPYEQDEVTRLLLDTHDAAAFRAVRHLTVGDFRDWLLSDAANETALTALAPALLPEMVAAVSKLMRNQDLILAAGKCRVVTTRFRKHDRPARHACQSGCSRTIRLTTRAAITASTVDGLMYGCGDAVHRHQSRPPTTSGADRHGC